MKKNRETAQEKMMDEITQQMKQHLERLCEQEEPEDFLKAYRMDPEEEIVFCSMYIRYGRRRSVRIGMHSTDSGRRDTAFTGEQRK